MVEAEVQDKSESAASKNRSHQECVALTSSAFVGVPVGGGQCHTDGGPSAADNCMVYGELTYEGMGALHDALNLQPHDSLYDLGSGIGKFILYSALRNQCASATGVEVGLKRHASAELACSKLEELLSSDEKESSAARRCAGFNAVLGDIRLPLYRDATAIIICNIMFDGTLNASIVANILKSCPRVTTVASIVKLHHPRFKRRKSVSCGCTWSTGGVSWTLYTVLPPAEAVRPRSNLRNRAEPVTPWTRPKAAEFWKRIPTSPPRPSTVGPIEAREEFWQRISSTTTGSFRSRLAARPVADLSAGSASRGFVDKRRSSLLASRLDTAMRAAGAAMADAEGHRPATSKDVTLAGAC